MIRRDSAPEKTSSSLKFDEEEEFGDFVPPPVDIDCPRWDQSQFVGRLNHFARITNPLLIFNSGQLDHAAKLVKMARYTRVRVCLVGFVCVCVGGYAHVSVSVSWYVLYVLQYFIGTHYSVSTLTLALKLNVAMHVSIIQSNTRS